MSMLRRPVIGDLCTWSWSLRSRTPVDQRSREIFIILSVEPVTEESSTIDCMYQQHAVGKYNRITLRTSVLELLCDSNHA